MNQKLLPRLLPAGFLLCLSLFLAALSDQTPAPAPAVSLSQAKKLLAKGKSTLEEGLLDAARRAFENGLRRGDSGCRSQLAWTYLYLAWSAELNHQRDQAKRLVDKGIEVAREEVRLKSESGPAHCLLARLYETKISYGDFFAAIDIGPKIAEENKIAFRLDPQNPLVLLSLGIQYVMAPPIGGGDVKKGLVYLEKTLKLNPRLSEAYYWMAKGYRKQNDRENFRKVLEKQLKMDPANILAKKELADWLP